MRVLLALISVNFIFFFCSDVYAGTDELHEVGKRLQKCEEKWCLSVAQPPSSWPSPLKGDSISIEEHPAIMIDIPAGFIRIKRTDYLLMFIYKNKKVLTFEEISRESFPDLHENTKKSKMTMADAVQATFTRTTRDKAPECPDDRKFWYWAMFLKMAFFEDGSTVFSSKKESLTAYYLSEKRDTGTIINNAVVINGNSPDYILKLGSANMSFEEFKSVIGTITQRKGINP